MKLDTRLVFSSLKILEDTCLYVPLVYFFKLQVSDGFTKTQWSSCLSTSQQCLLDASSPVDPAAFTNTTCFQGSVPSYYVCPTCQIHQFAYYPCSVQIDVASADDVIKAFQFANQTSVQLTIKNSGHDFKGRSSMRGSLSLWVSILLHGPDSYLTLITDPKPSKCVYHL